MVHHRRVIKMIFLAVVITRCSTSMCITVAIIYYIGKNSTYTQAKIKIFCAITRYTACVKASLSDIVVDLIPIDKMSVDVWFISIV